MLLNLNKNKAR